MTVTPVAVSPCHLLEHRLQGLVSAELTRLARRVPALADDHLGVVEASLEQIINRLLPAPGRMTMRPETLAALFDLEAS